MLLVKKETLMEKVMKRAKILAGLKDTITQLREKGYQLSLKKDQLTQKNEALVRETVSQRMALIQIIKMFESGRLPKDIVDKCNETLGPYKRAT